MGHVFRILVIGIFLILGNQIIGKYLVPDVTRLLSYFVLNHIWETAKTYSW
jgi:hypothetical protein